MIKIDKIINSKDLNENDIIVIKFSKEFENFETLNLINKSSKNKLKNPIIFLQEGMNLDVLTEDKMNEWGWYKRNQLKDKK